MNRTMRVRGKGNLKVRPDMTRVSISLANTCKNYDEALSISAENSNLLRKIVCELGFAESDLKTVSFDVDVQNESYRDRNDNWKKRFVGYKVSHSLKFDFASDNDLLGRLLGRIAACPAKPEFGISFFVKDTEAAKNQLLGNAIRDAKAKAFVLAEASGVKLGDIRNIDYSWGEIRFESDRMPIEGDLGCKEETRHDIDIEPDDIEVADTVTVEWEIV